MHTSIFTIGKFNRFFTNSTLVHPVRIFKVDDWKVWTKDTLNTALFLKTGVVGISCTTLRHKGVSHPRVVLLNALLSTVNGNGINVCLHTRNSIQLRHRNSNFRIKPGHRRSNTVVQVLVGTRARTESWNLFNYSGWVVRHTFSLMPKVIDLQ